MYKVFYIIISFKLKRIVLRRVHYVQSTTLGDKRTSYNNSALPVCVELQQMSFVTNILEVANIFSIKST